MWPFPVLDLTALGFFLDEIWFVSMHIWWIHQNEHADLWWHSTVIANHIDDAVYYLIHFFFEFISWLLQVSFWLFQMSLQNIQRHVRIFM